MLNELYLLSKALEKAGITPHDWHKDLKPLPNATTKKPCYKIFIGLDGSIAGVEILVTETACLRKWEPSNGNSFPGFNIQPLYRVTDGAIKKCLKKWRDGKEAFDFDLIKEWCVDKQAKNWDAKFDKKIKKCLGDIPQELQKRCCQSSNDFKAFMNLCERVAICEFKDPDIFFKALKDYIYKALEKGENALSLLPILIHEGSPEKKPIDDRGSISVFLDVSDWDTFPVAHEKTIKFINEQLLCSNSHTSTNSEEIDAFGLEQCGHDEKLPEVKLPLLGGVKLRAMNKESPCQFRYGTIDADSFCIGGASRKLSKGAIEWLSSDDLEGQTWGRADGRELIFAYPEIIPKTLPKLAACFGANKADDTEARFANYAEDVMTCLRGLATSLKDLELRVFSLRKMDKARTKVVFHRNYSAQRLADAAKEWQKGCKNIPAVRIKSWGKTKGEVVLLEPDTPFPLQIAACLNRTWKLDGTTECETKSIPVSAGLELLLEEKTAQRQVPYLLTVLLQNSRGLFISLGNAIHRGEAIKIDKLNKQKQLMPSILGLLLWKLGIGKEIYMNNPSYLVGRLLKLADELHALYCKEVRKNNLPPQLLGNALMAAALDSPLQALAQLALRIAPYLGWARTNSTSSVGLSRYFLREFGQVEAELRNVELPHRLNDAAKAQLLLGYISSNAQTDENTTI